VPACRVEQEFDLMRKAVQRLFFDQLLNAIVPITAWEQFLIQKWDLEQNGKTTT
jgi:hypothetical protein